MNPKIASILDKASRERARGGHSKALQRIAAGIDEYPLELDLYKEAISLGLEAGEPLQAIKFFKKALGRFASNRDELYEYAAAMERKAGDPVFGKYLLELSIKNKNLPLGFRVAHTISQHLLEDLLLRIRKKGETLSSALRSGHKVEGEITVNEISEAILLLAQGNIRKAVEIISRHMDANSVQSELYEPLLLELEKLHPKDGHLRYALGSCYLSRNDINRGVQKVLHAIKLTPDLVDDIDRRVQPAAGGNPALRDSLKIALLEAYSLQGNTPKVSSLAQSILEENPRRSSEVLDLIRKHIEKKTANWDLEEFYLDACLRSNQTKRIRSHLDETWQHKDKRRNNLDWLEAHAESGSLPADLQIYFGRLVLEEGRTDWAIRIFRRAASTSPNDAYRIIQILEKQPHCEPQVRELCEELKTASQESVSDGEGEFDIQSFEPAEFSLSNFEKDSDDSKLIADHNAHAGETVRPSGKDDVFAAESVTLKDLADGNPQELQTNSSPPQQEPERAETRGSIGAEAKKDFDSLYRDYIEGKLDNLSILDLIDTAFDRGKLENARSLLDFHPVTIREEVARILRLADYYMYTDRPLSGLVALKSLDAGTLNQGEKKDYLTRMTACYRALKMYEAAHCVILNLMNDEPSDPQLALLARANYEDYLNERCEGALILEKVCFPNS